MERKDIFIALGQALFSVLGACVKWLDMKDKKRQKLFSLISEVISAAFSGFLVYCIYSWLDLNIYVSFAIAGIIGNQGAKSVDLLGKFIVRNSGLNGLDGLGREDKPGE